MSMSVKVKTKKTRKIKRKYEITSVDKILKIKEKLSEKSNWMSKDMKNE